MAQQGNGGPPTAPAFNPNTMGGIQQGDPGQRSLLGILNDSPGLSAFDTQGFGAKKLQLFSSASSGWKSSLEKHLGFRTSVKFEGFEGVQAAPVDTSGSADSGGGGGNYGNATYEQIYGAGQVILANGGQLRGFSAHEMLGEMQAPATPGMGQGKGKGIFGV